MNKSHGFTLLEITIATVVLSMVLIATFSGFLVASNSAAENVLSGITRSAEDDLEKELQEELRTAELVDFSSSPPRLALRRPRPGALLSDLTEGETVPWSGTARIIRFRHDRDLNESLLGQDVNQDGDMEDTFALGRLVIGAASRERAVLSRRWIVLAGSDLDGDVDGDGEADPLFTMDANFLRYRMFLATEVDGRWRLSRVEGRVQLRNQSR